MSEPVNPDDPAAGCPDLDWVDVADALWLAAVVGLTDPARAWERAEPSRVQPSVVGDDETADTDVPAVVFTPGESPMGARSWWTPTTQALHSPSMPVGLAELDGDTHGQPALPGSRDIARALAPFKRRVQSLIANEIDEEATAERAADGGPWLPQMRPAPARWLALAVVTEASASMTVWEPMLGAFRRLLKQHGAFRRYRECVLSTVGEGEAAGIRILTGPRAGECHPAELVDPSGRQIIMVLTDGHSALWRGRPIADLMRLWGRTGPVAVVNPYPQRYWHRTNLCPHRAQIRVPRLVAANSELAVRQPQLWRDPFDEIAPSGFPVPVLELSPRWIRWWANLVTRPSGGWTDASLYFAGDIPPTDQPAPEPPQSSRDLVLRFRTAATPLAFRLATHLAAAPLDLPLVRRIQGAMLPQSSPHHLAEVMTSDLVRCVPDHANPPRLDFAAGVREVLLSSSTRDDSAQVLRMVARHYGDRFPGGEAMTLMIDAPGQAPDQPITVETLPLARIELAVLRALSGPYAVRADRLARSIALAEDGETSGSAGPSAEQTRPVPPGPWDLQSGGDEEMIGPPGENEFDDPGWLTAHPAMPPDPYPLPGRGLHADDDAAAMPFDLLLDGQEQGIGPAIWGNVPPRNPVFTGRGELLAQLELRLRTESMTAVLPQALHGMGGVGKSQIAIEYTYRNRSKYQLVWWVPSEQPSQILASLVELSLLLGHEPGLAASDAVLQVQAALRAGSPYEDWLLIFDNAETLDAVRPYFPEAGSGKVLVTSRNPEWSHVAQTLEVDVFTREESIELLKRRNPAVSDEEADRLARTLGDLPLAVEHASAWCATTGISVPEYLNMLQQKLVELEALVPTPGYELPVAAAWNVALDRLREDNLPALRLLQVCSSFAPEPISRELFTSPRTYPTVPELDEALRSPTVLARAFRDIQKFGLARIDHRSNTIQLHRLVKAVLVGRMSEERRRKMEHSGHLLLAGGNPGTPDNQSQWRRYQELAPHVTASQAIICEDSWTRELVLDVIDFYFRWGDASSSRDLARQAFNGWQTLLSPDHPQTLRAGKWLAYMQWTLGAFTEAREINRDCLERLQHTVGPEDEGTIDAMSRVAADLRVAGEFAQAHQLDLDAFRRARRALGEDDPMTLKAAHNLGVSLRLIGDFSTARRLDRDTHGRRAAILGDDHFETLLTLNGLTLDHRECGAYLQAHMTQERLYERYQSRFGANHPATIAAARNLAVARRRAGHLQSARKLAEDTVRRYRQRFGEDNPETIAASLILAVDLREAGELEQARVLGEQTAVKYQVVLGSSHPYTLYARTNYAIVLRLLGRASESYEHNSAVLEALRERLGYDHILTLTCAINLASDLSQLGDHQTAYELDVDTVDRCRQAIGAEHPSTLACELNLSFDLSALGRDQEGTRLYNHTLVAYRKALGEEHTAIAAAIAGARANCDVDPMPL
jgi:hypothetical protein